MKRQQIILCYLLFFVGHTVESLLGFIGVALPSERQPERFILAGRSAGRACTFFLY